MRKQKLIFWLIACVLMCTAVTYIAYAQAGSTDDPVITLSYIKQVFKPEVKSELTFKVVSVEKGKKVIGASGTEMILRMGSANVVATSKGGIANVTVGSDYSNNSTVYANNLYIIPLDDGRGMYATTDCLIMIKGDYTIS